MRSPRSRPNICSIPLFRFFFSSRRRHTSSLCDWSSDVCSSDLFAAVARAEINLRAVQNAIRAVGKPDAAAKRSEERRVGKECRSRRWPYHEKKKDDMTIKVEIGRPHTQETGSRTHLRTSPDW